MLSHGVSILYSFFANKKKVEEQGNEDDEEVITSITKKEFRRISSFSFGSHSNEGDG
jgi:hypothetical protein